MGSDDRDRDDSEADVCMCLKAGGRPTDGTDFY